MTGFTRRLGSAFELLAAWYWTPVGLVYVAVLLVGSVVSAVQRSALGICAAGGFVLLVLIPYKLARERRDWRAGDRARARVSRRRVRALRHGVNRLDAGLISERTAMLGSLETIRRESRDVIWSERLYWRTALDDLATNANELAAAVERGELLGSEVAARLARVEHEIAELVMRLGARTLGGDGPATSR